MILLAAILIIIVISAIYAAERKRKYENSQYYRERGTSFYEMMGNTGGIGEYRTSEVLSSFIPNGRMIINAYIPRYNEYSEIDIIFITVFGIYVIENKNYSGWIFGNENDKNWTETYQNGKKFRFYNPVKQNRTHVKFLGMLLDKANIRYGKIHSIICFNDNASLKKITSSIPVTQTRNICRYINTSQIVMTQEQVERIYNFLKPYAIYNKKERQQHIYQQQAHRQ